ncbi:MAG TPA: GAF domain-containing protein [Polyangiaceae bacterium]|nr:GAF domain-containing protein [Polyangiaceae bacterium]
MTSEGRLETLADAMHDFVEATVDYQRLLRTIARRVAELFGGACLVHLTSTDGGWLEPAVVHVADPTMARLVGRSVSRGPLRIDPAFAGLRRGEPTWLPVPTADGVRERFEYPEDAEAAIALGFSDILALPMRAHGSLVGSLNLCRYGSAPPLDGSDLHLALSLADHAALALSTARLVTDLQRQSERLRVFTEAAHEFTAAIGDLDRLLDAVARRVVEVLGDLCTIRLIAPDRSEFSKVGALHHRDPSVAALARELMITTPQRLGEGISGQVAVTGKPVLLPTFDADEMARRIPRYGRLIERIRVTSLIAVPLSVQGEVLGVLTVGRGAPRPPYTEDDLAVVDGIAGHAALAARNALLLQSVRHAQARLREAEKMEAVGHLAGGVAHDFNNVLTVILGYSALVIHRLDRGDPTREDVDQIRIAGERAQDMTRQLLAFSRRQVLVPRVLFLDTIVRGMEPMLKRLLGEDVELSIPAGAAAVHPTRVDPGQMEQVLLNLAVNARDSMPAGGRLAIETRDVELDAEYARSQPEVAPGPHVMLSVSDTGVGMDEATQSRIFEPFFTTKPVGRGTGLGLATVYGIVKQSGGSIRVSSAPGEGATFRLYFPRAVEAPVEARRIEGLAPAHGSETVLLVEDETQVRALLGTVLSGAGYEVLSAGSAGEALLISEQHGGLIHLLLTDVVMPRMSGRQLAARLAGSRADMKVLFMSGYTDDAIVHHGVVDSGVHFMQKPVNPEGLLRKVRQVLDGVE